MISLLVGLLVLCLVYWCAERLMAAFGIGDPIHTVVIVLLVILAVWYLLGVVGAVGPVRLR